MRHRKANVKLGRTASHRRAMLRNMATSLFESGKITTTIFKAKAVKPVVDRLITLAKRGDLHSRRQAGSVLTKPEVLKELFDTAKERFQDRVCGYTSMIRIGLRAGDVAPMVVLELLGTDSVQAVRGKPTAKKISDRSRRVQSTRSRPSASVSSEGLLSPAGPAGPASPDSPAASASPDSSETSNSSEISASPETPENMESQVTPENLENMETPSPPEAVASGSEPTAQAPEEVSVDTPSDPDSQPPK
jgi:large subunit ribosomal protein L17